MAFVSDISTLTPIIDDSNWQQHASAPAGQGRGRQPRPWNQVPLGAIGPFCGPLDIPLIPRSEWTDRIEEMERTKTRVSDMRRQAGMKSLDQNGTNYCWCNAVVSAMQLFRLVNGQPFVALSPASVAAPIKGYRNQGGWGGEALEYIVENGIASTEFWPPNAISRSYFDGAKENRKLHMVTEWYDLQSRNFDQLMTCLLLRIPVAIGLNWWSHEVCAIDPVVVSSGRYGARILNSWSDSYGDQGEAVLSESKATPDDACAPRLITASTT